MKTNNIHIIREAVILLLRQNGHSAIEAVDKWDNVYSRQYELAAPGVWHTWLIGKYEFEFTKQGEPKITETPTETVARGWNRLVVALAALGLIALAVCVFLIRL